ncbi:MAG TPA: hypothetical protein ENI05_06290 [Porticoccus sp.]|nr:hypothetical protein [Porticoccus sp.]
MLRNIVTWFQIISLSILLLGGYVYAETQQGAGSTDKLLKFTVVALSKEHSIRRDFENELVKNLRANNYDAIASYSLLPDISSLHDPALRLKLQEEGIQGVLLLRPIDIGEQASIQSAQKQIAPKAYNTIEAFVTDYRGGDFSTQAVVQVSGFLLSEAHTANFWQGIIWLDDNVKTREEGIEKLSDLVLSNLNASRGYLRKRLGFKPLTTD